jgi:L-alanine-DL-glutamate epimerase-like enolase superfamily enzyme
LQSALPPGAAAPRTNLLMDASEAPSFEDLRRLAPEFARLEVKLLEQALPTGQDEELGGL